MEFNTKTKQGTSVADVKMIIYNLDNPPPEPAAENTAPASTAPAARSRHPPPSLPPVIQRPILLRPGAARARPSPPQLTRNPPELESSLPENPRRCLQPERSSQWRRRSPRTTLRWTLPGETGRSERRRQEGQRADGDHLAAKPRSIKRRTSPFSDERGGEGPGVQCPVRQVDRAS